MNMKNYIWMAFAALALTACDASQTDVTQSTTAETPTDFRGEYNLGNDCSKLDGIMRVTPESIRVIGTVCQIQSSRYVNTSSTEYVLGGCESQGTEQPDRKAIISEVEDGQILLSGWVADDFAFNMCS